MGKCLRSSCQQRLSPAVEAAAYLTLRSGRRVPAAAGSPTRRRQRPGERCCSKTGARQRRGRRVPQSGEAKHDDHESDARAESRPASSPPQAEVEAFFAAAELAERRRFMETYNFDIALDRPLEGRFDWSPVST